MPPQIDLAPRGLNRLEDRLQRALAVGAGRQGRFRGARHLLQDRNQLALAEGVAEAGLFELLGQPRNRLDQLMGLGDVQDFHRFPGHLARGSGKRRVPGQQGLTERLVPLDPVYKEGPGDEQFVGDVGRIIVMRGNLFGQDPDSRFLEGGVALVREVGAAHVVLDTPAGAIVRGPQAGVVRAVARTPDQRPITGGGRGEDVVGGPGPGIDVVRNHGVRGQIGRVEDRPTGFERGFREGGVGIGIGHRKDMLSARRKMLGHAGAIVAYPQDDRKGGEKRMAWLTFFGRDRNRAFSPRKLRGFQPQ